MKGKGFQGKNRRLLQGLTEDISGDDMPVYVCEGCPIHPVCIGSPKWWRSVTDRDGSAAFVSSRHVVGSLRSGRMVTSVAVCQFARDLENIHGVCFGFYFMQLVG